MGAVNRVPRGFLGLLDAKTQGKTPADTTGFVSPVIDLTPNYLADIPIQVEQASQVGNTVGTLYGTVTVPNGELWYVYFVTSEGIATAAGALNVIPVLVTSSGTLSVPLEKMEAGLGSYAATESMVSVATFPDGFLLGPGTRFATRITNPGGANISMITSVVYRSVQV